MPLINKKIKRYLASRKINSLRSEEGITLIEVLISVAMGGIILYGVIMLFTFIVSQDVQVEDAVTTNQNGRLALATISQELHSTCVGPGVTPIQSGGTVASDGIVTYSSDTEIDFISAYASSQTIASPTLPTDGTSNSVQLHKLVFDSSQGTLTDTSYPAISGFAPHWVFSSTPDNSAELLSGVTQTGSTPVFQYYRYYNDSDPDVDYGSINPSALPASSGLSAQDADETSEVTISFTALPTMQNDNNVALPFTSTVSFRLTPPSTTPGANNLPCF